MNGRLAHVAFFNLAVSADKAKQLHAAAGLPAGAVTKPLEVDAPAVAADDPKAKIAQLEK